jgi:hypothetical protein
MGTFLHGLDRTLIHLYCVAGLVIAFTFLVDTVAYDQAAFAAAKAQAEALTAIALELHHTVL